LSLGEIGDLSLTSKSCIPFNTVCAVFGKSDAIKYLRKGAAKSDILAGLHDAIAVRSHNLLRRISIEKDFSITGGISKNKGMVAKLAEKVGLEPLLCEDPQLVGAIGAALFARERFTGAKAQAIKTHQYGYSDGTGEYFITIDASLCDGCGDCITACPAGVLTIGKSDDGQLKCKVRDEVRKKLALLCPGFQTCSSEHKVNCHSVCTKNAIHHSW